MNHSKKENFFYKYKPFSTIAVIFLLMGVSIAPVLMASKPQEIEDTLLHDLNKPEIYKETSDDIYKRETPGTIPGSFTVDNFGQASYSIPIEIPPGTAGIEPSLSINYNSRGGSSVLGVGFTIGGLSAIIRDSCDLARDGYIAPRFSDSSRLSLDGSRLVIYNGEVQYNEFTNIWQYFEYHPNLVSLEFRKQIDDNTRILAYGKQGMGLSYFTVESPNGFVMTYGKTDMYDGRIYASEPNNFAPFAWVLTQVHDQYGNYILYEYEKDMDNSHYWITNIRYTGNFKTEPVLAPYCEVRFLYENRNDVVPGYEGGSKFSITNRLKNIKTFVDDQIILNYEFLYEYGLSGKSQLSNITLYDRDNNYYPSTIFDWRNEQWWGGIDQIQTTTELGGWYDNQQIIMDVNGNGREDIVHVFRSGSSGIVRVFLSSGMGTFSCVSEFSINPYNEYTKLHKGDINGDGKMDLIIHRATGTEIWLSTGSSFEYSYSIPTNAGNYGQILILDVNGDRMDDIVVIRDDPPGKPQGMYYTYYRSTGTSFVLEVFEQFLATKSNLEKYSEYVILDINDDGRKDIVRINATNPDHMAPYDYTVFACALPLISTGNGFITEQQGASYFNLGYWGMAYWDEYSQSYYLLKNNEIFSADINGDGKSDIIKIGADENIFKIRLSAWVSNGHNSFIFLSSYVSDDHSYSFYNPPKFFASEIDGDGKEDIVMVQRSIGSSQLQCYWIKSNGLGFFDIALLGLICYQGDYDSVIYPIDLNGNSKKDIIYINKNGNNAVAHVALCNGEIYDKLPTIINGLGVKISITYQPLPMVYKGHCGSLPADSYHFINRLWVVTQVSKSSGINANVNLDENRQYYYSYKGGKFHRLGYGFLGFEQITTKELYEEISPRNKNYNVKTIEYMQNYPFIGLIKEKRFSTLEGLVSYDITSQANFYHTITLSDIFGNLRYRVLWSGTTTEAYNYPQGTVLSKSNSWVHDLEYDEYGNPLNIVSRVWGVSDPEDMPVSLQITMTEWENRIGSNQWMIGFPTKITVQRAHNWTHGWRIKTASYFYNDEGSLWNIINEPDSSTNNELYLETENEFDLFGNTIESKSYYSSEGVTHEILHFQVQYDARGRFVLWEKNAMDHQVSYDEWDAGFGFPLRVIDVNGLTTSYEYDGFGRVEEIVYPDGVKTKMFYDFNDGVLAATKYRIRTATSGQPTQYVFYDKLGRVTETTVPAIDGKHFRTRTYYDSFGRVSRQSQPYFSGDNKYYTEYSYDTLSRITQTKTPFDTFGIYAVTSFEYNGFETVIIDPEDRVSKTRVNPLGQIVEVEDALGRITSYEYDSSGNLIKQVDPAGIEKIWEYDVRNRVIMHVDPNSGVHSFSYNALNQIVEKFDNKDQLFQMEYDDLGRLIRMDYPEGYSIWMYDEAEYGIGNLWKSEKHTSSNTVVSKTELEYDELSRLKVQSKSFGGNTYDYSFSYDSFSRLESMTYPSGMQLVYGYDEQGYNTKISRVDKVYIKEDVQSSEIPPARGMASPGGGISIDDEIHDQSSSAVTRLRSVWELVEMSPFGHVTKEKLGNGLVYQRVFNPASGRLEQISSSPMASPSEYLQNSNYYFTYAGNMWRRSIYQGFGVSYLDEFFDYDALNRLVSTSGTATAASIEYDFESGNIYKKSDVGPEGYGLYFYDGIRPNAVDEIKGYVTGIGFTTVFDFSYDGNGNMISKTNLVSGEELSISYNSFNLPVMLQKPVDGSSVPTFVHYVYDESGNKIGKMEGDQGVFTLTRIVDNLYEEVHQGNNVEKRHYIYAGGRPVAMYSLSGDGSIYNGETRYLHNDILGSVEVITDDSGAIVERFSYDAWGKRRNVDGTPLNDLFDGEFTDRGFTGHRHVDSLGLIDMNARMYDPVIGMFVSVDPLGDGYRYCFNNPLKFTDPTGLWAEYDFYDDRDDGLDRPQEPQARSRKECVSFSVEIDGMHFYFEECVIRQWAPMERMEPKGIGLIDNPLNPTELEHRESQFSFDFRDDELGVGEGRCPEYEGQFDNVYLDFCFDGSSSSIIGTGLYILERIYENKMMQNLDDMNMLSDYFQSRAEMVPSQSKNYMNQLGRRTEIMSRRQNRLGATWGVLKVGGYVISAGSMAYETYQFANNPTVEGGISLTSSIGWTTISYVIGGAAGTIVGLIPVIGGIVWSAEKANVQRVMNDPTGTSISLSTMPMGYRR